ncbi:MAG: phosphoribosyltransferase family protein [Patescibacteria group bacterium]|nr:phosphoribosyltransferase family protein [Patescibacteria group bacterium]
MRKVAILPYDGINTAEELFAKIQKDLNQPKLRKIVDYIKINDGIHNPDCGGPAIIDQIKELIAEAGLNIDIFLDMKVFDVDATLKNYARKYGKQAPGILTVSSICSVSGILALRQTLPKTKLAMISVPTDISEGECQRRFGMTAKMKILNDIENIRAEYIEKAKSMSEVPAEPFDLIVCSVKEVSFLKNNLPESYGFIVPGIRDSWMLADHQQRKGGVAEAMSLGATFLVMGAQLTKGNPEANPPISAEESQERTIAEIEKAEAKLFKIPPLEILKNCDGYYSAKNEAGEIIGPLVAYAGTYETKDGQKKNKVGFEYFNFAKAEENPEVLDYFAKTLAEKLKPLQPDMIIGAAMGGIFLTGLTAKHLACRLGFTEKKVVKPADPINGTKEVSELIIDRHEIKPGDKIVVIEDVVNNYSTTEKMKELIEEKGGQFLGIGCAVNRSGEISYDYLPVKSVCFVKAEQFQQDDSEVAELIAAGKIVWKAKQSWPELKAAMNKKKEE